MLALAALVAAQQGAAQSAPESYVWENGKALQPLSSTARAITGPLRVTRQAISFGKRTVPAKVAQRVWRVWSPGGDKQTGTIYSLASDPGTLLQGNTLCGGKDKAHWLVLWQTVSDFSGPSVDMAVFSSIEMPTDGNSAGLCGTFSYEWK
ncbi:hypothetical protein SR41_04675 [Sphingomonas melonis]|uniref:Uncharacterized protein n=1 Tax=Sphingomonas melonis TaxID=152682 RepID=A0A0D1MPH2_9SPHN|nr:hypothetical protein SR41_04675 [Sphingomonas melonis]